MFVVQRGIVFFLKWVCFLKKFFAELLGFKGCCLMKCFVFCFSKGFVEGMMLYHLLGFLCKSKHELMGSSKKT